jgi:large subunit ribosomal protein L9
MKVILLQELRGKGGEGDVVEVATGYAVNYLFPKKIAIEASKGNLKQLDLRRHNIAKREEQRLGSADKMLADLEGKVVRIAAKVGEEGQLFGSVTTTQIAEALTSIYGIEVDRKNIDLRSPIKTAGEHVAVVSIYREVKANVQVLVVDENAPEEDPDAADGSEAEGDVAEASEAVEDVEGQADAEAASEAIDEDVEAAEAAAEA